LVSTWSGFPLRHFVPTLLTKSLLQGERVSYTSCSCWWVETMSVNCILVRSPDDIWESTAMVQRYWHGKQKNSDKDLSQWH
jgi:hypothetical protein